MNYSTKTFLNLKHFFILKQEPCHTAPILLRHKNFQHGSLQVTWEVNDSKEPMLQIDQVLHIFLKYTFRELASIALVP